MCFILVLFVCVCVCVCVYVCAIQNNLLNFLLLFFEYPYHYCVVKLFVMKVVLLALFISNVKNIIFVPANSLLYPAWLHIIVSVIVHHHAKLFLVYLFMKYLAIVLFIHVYYFI